jgi:hypothetical protein
MQVRSLEKPRKKFSGANLDVEAEVLENAFVRLEPLAEAHREGLRAACEADLRVWRSSIPIPWPGNTSTRAGSG